MNHQGEIDDDDNASQQDVPSDRVLVYVARKTLILVIPQSMIVRESPSPRKEPQEPSISWPPKSARDALLSSPSGVKRLQQTTAQVETSPSASKKRRLANLDPEEQSHDTSDGDEETLRLEIQAMEARLKLKKLQKAKSRSTVPHGRDASPGRRHVQVPSSPKPPKPQPPKIQEPSRQIQLGIDKGIAAKDMSLKRPKTANSKGAMAPPPPKKTFSERLAESRSNDIARQEKHQKLEQRQNHSFHISASAMETQKMSSQAQNQLQLKQSPGTRVTDSAPVPNAANTDSEASDTFDPYSGFSLSRRILFQETLKSAFDDKELMSIPRLLKVVVSPNYDPPDVDKDYVVFGIISHKTVPHEHAAKHQSKSNADPDDPEAVPPRSKFMVLKLTDLTWELDCFLFDSAFEHFKTLTVGTVLALLNPAIMPPKPAFRHTGKFSLKLVSNEGTLLEIGKAKDLCFCKARKKDGQTCSSWVDGRKTEFCEYHVNERTIKAKVNRMEVNSMATLSAFGRNDQEKKRKKPEKREPGSERWAKKNSGNYNPGTGRGRTIRGVESGTYVDSSAQAVGYVIPKKYCNEAHTARLLDAEDYVHGGLSKEERSRRRLAATQQEQELAKALSAQGSGMGKEYMRSRRPDNAGNETVDDSNMPSKRVDAESLGLVRHNAAESRLSPVSKRRKLGGHTAEPMGWSGAFKRGLLSLSRNENAGPPNLNGQEGVSGQLTAAPAAAATAAAQEQAERPASPSKRARFFLKEKGIRVPGRDSEGRAATNDDNHDDDDDLDIIY